MRGKLGTKGVIELQVEPEAADLQKLLASYQKKEAKRVAAEKKMFGKMFGGAS